MPKMKTHEKFLEDFKLKSKHYDNIEVIGKYNGDSNNIECRCKKDGYIWNPKPTNLLQGYGCPKCFGRHRTHEEFIELFSKMPKYNDIEVIGKYINYETKILCRCKKDGYEWYVSPEKLLGDRGCPVCGNNILAVGINDLWTTHKEIAELLLNPEDGYKYSFGSNKKLEFLCKNCKKHVFKKSVYNMVNNLNVCPLCSDKTPYPEKFIFSLLCQLNILFDKDLSFKWSNKKRYDFYINNMNMIIETHGKQHYDEWFKTNRSLEEEQVNDEYKEKLAKENFIKDYIILNCRKSELEWIKNSVLDSKLNELFDLTNIDWGKCDKDALSSNVINVYKLYNTKQYSIKEIAEILKLKISTVNKYLNKAIKSEFNV